MAPLGVIAHHDLSARLASPPHDIQGLSTTPQIARSQVLQFGPATTPIENKLRTDAKRYPGELVVGQ